MSDRGAALLQLELPPDQTAARQARAAIAAALSALVSDGCNQVVLLLASELVTNAVLHARSRVELGLWAEPELVRVEVHDQSPALPRIRRYGALSTTGRGVRLLEHLATRWDVLPGATGKTVWFELATDVDPAAMDEPFVLDLDAFNPW